MKKMEVIDLLHKDGQSSKKYTTSEEEYSEPLHLKSKETGSLAKIYPSGFFSNLKDVLKISLPVILQQILLYSTSIISLMFCGHLGSIALDSVGLANSLTNILGISLAVGMCAACDTLFSQVYGSGNNLKMGVVLQRSICILCLVMLLSISLLINMEGICLLLGQDPEVSWWTGQYTLLLVPGVMFYYVYCIIMKFLQNQNHVVPTVLIGLLSVVINVICHYLLIYVADMGIFGSAVSQSLTYFVMLLLGILYIIVSGLHKTCWDGWSIECLADWGQFVNLGIFGLVMICAEWWSYEISIILAGLLGKAELGAQSVVLQIQVLVYMVPIGNGIALSILVGQYLGGSNPMAAKTVARVGITFIFILGMITGILLASLRDYLPRIFTSNADVLSLTSSILPFHGFCILFDSVVGTSAGILRGAGRQSLGGLLIFIGYTICLVIGIPLMFLTSFKILGFWTGLAIALLILAILLSTYIYRMDWEEESIKACKRVGVDVSQSMSDKTSHSNQENECLIENKKQREGRDVRRDVCRSIFVTLFFIAVLITAILIRLYVILPDKENDLPGPMMLLPIINTTMATSAISNSYF